MGNFASNSQSQPFGQQATSMGNWQQNNPQSMGGQNPMGEAPPPMYNPAMPSPQQGMTGLLGSGPQYNPANQAPMGAPMAPPPLSGMTSTGPQFDGRPDMSGSPGNPMDGGMGDPMRTDNGSRGMGLQNFGTRPDMSGSPGNPMGGGEDQAMSMNRGMGLRNAPMPPELIAALQRMQFGR